MDVHAVTPDQLRAGGEPPTALTFDDVLLVPWHSQVLPTQVDVDERGDPTVCQDLGAEGRVALDEPVEHLAHARADRLDLPGSSDLRAQRRRDADGDAHACTGAEQNST